MSESLNPYSYAWNNPLKWVDPSGFQDEAPPPSTPSEDIGSCGTGCVEWTPQEGEIITVQTAANTNATMQSETSDDNGSLTPPTMVDAPDPGPNSCCAAASDPSEWAPFPKPREASSASNKEAPTGKGLDVPRIKSILFPPLDMAKAESPLEGAVAPNEKEKAFTDALSKEVANRHVMLGDPEEARIYQRYRDTRELLSSEELRP